ncbi:MAG: ribosome small subunit-dependent GTPase A [Firmicutes bacterium]|nr:ribosome small subunit-dependent GTPase A [Bacillota bacterium]
MNTMKRYGFDERFTALASMYSGFVVGRIISQEKGLYRLVTECGEKVAEISGKFRYDSETLSDYPAVGDFVMVDWNEAGGNAIIHHVLQRKSCFIRKAAGEGRQEQVVAANVDTLFLCMALNNDFNLRRLERYLSIGWDSGAIPVIVLTKSDLCTDLEEKLVEIGEVAIGVNVLVTSSMETDGEAEIRPYITKGKTVAFIGSSGVGKSTLINRLLGEDILATNGLRNDDKGRHTTTRRELILLSEGGMVIDTPGMRELGMWDNESGIEQTFSDIEELAERCRFYDCTHTSEPDCAIREALGDGTLSQERWMSYLKLKTELDYMEDSTGYLAQKEKKFKDISKTLKKMKKNR